MALMDSLIPYVYEDDEAPKDFTCHRCKRLISGDEARYVRLVTPTYRSPFAARLHFLNHEYGGV